MIRIWTKRTASANRPGEDGEVSKQDLSAYRVDDREFLLGFYRWLIWNRLLPILPRGLSPNTITVAGQGFGILAAVAAGLAVVSSPWLLVVSGFFLFGYLTADNLDGAHARRTGQCSRLGEYLDHGLDGIASAVCLLCAAYTLGLGGPWLLALFAIGSVGFLLPFWEQYRTGLLTIPRGGTTEAVTVIVFVQIVAAILQQPEWLLFSDTRITVGTVLMIIPLIGYPAMTILPTMFRAFRAGVVPIELLPVVVLVTGGLLFAFIDAHPLFPSIMMAGVAADFVCRFILKRHSLTTAWLIRPVDLLLLVCPIAAVALPQLKAANIFAIAGMCVALLFYLITVTTGSIRMGRKPSSA